MSFTINQSFHNKIENLPINTSNVSSGDIEKSISSKKITPSGSSSGALSFLAENIIVDSYNNDDNNIISFSKKNSNNNIIIENKNNQNSNDSLKNKSIIQQIQPISKQNPVDFWKSKKNSISNLNIKNNNNNNKNNNNNNNKMDIENSNRRRSPRGLKLKSEENVSLSEFLKAGLNIKKNLKNKKKNSNLFISYFF